MELTDQLNKKNKVKDMLFLDVPSEVNSIPDFIKWLEEPKKPEPDPKISVDQLEYLKTLINDDIEFKIKEKYEILDLAELTPKQAKICIDLAKKKMETKEEAKSETKPEVATPEDW